jgi:hypothetical protein
MIMEKIKDQIFAVRDSGVANYVRHGGGAEGGI